MSTVTFPWQQNGLQALSIPNAKSEFPLFALDVHLVSEGISRGVGVLPYMGYIGMCRCEGYDFQAVYSRTGYINQSVWV